jgi:hypothetical protein
MHDSSIVDTCANVQKLYAGNYLQADVVRAQYRDFPEFESLLDLAVSGASVMQPAGWVPNQGIGVKVRATTNMMRDAVYARMAQEQAVGDVNFGRYARISKTSGRAEYPLPYYRVGVGLQTRYQGIR